MKKEEIQQLFANNSDCYADTWDTSQSTPKEGKVIPAMTKEKFVEVVEGLMENLPDVNISLPADDEIKEQAKKENTFPAKCYPSEIMEHHCTIQYIEGARWMRRQAKQGMNA